MWQVGLTTVEAISFNYEVCLKLLPDMQLAGIRRIVQYKLSLKQNLCNLGEAFDSSSLVSLEVVLCDCLLSVKN